MGEIGTNIVMRWVIDKGINETNVDFMRLYYQVKSGKEEEIALVSQTPIATNFGKEYYENRLQTRYSDNEVTIDISDAKYKYGGKYRVEITFNSKERSTSWISLNIHGMFFSYQYFITKFLI